MILGLNSDRVRLDIVARLQYCKFKLQVYGLWPIDAPIYYSLA